MLFFPQKFRMVLFALLIKTNKSKVPNFVTFWHPRQYLLEIALFEVRRTWLLYCFIDNSNLSCDLLTIRTCHDYSRWKILLLWKAFKIIWYHTIVSKLFYDKVRKLLMHSRLPHKAHEGQLLTDHWHHSWLTIDITVLVIGLLKLLSESGNWNIALYMCSSDNIRSTKSLTPNWVQWKLSL